MIAKNCTLAFGLGPFCHSVVLQALHCRGKIVTLYFNKFQCPNWFFRDTRILGVSTDSEEKRAKKETSKYASSHVCTSPLELRMAMSARLDKNYSPAEALPDFR